MEQVPPFETRPFRSSGCNSLTMTEMPKLSELLALPPAERLALAEALWASLANEPEEPERVPMPDWHSELLDERMASDVDDPAPGESWEALRRRIEHGT